MTDHTRFCAMKPDYEKDWCGRDMRGDSPREDEGGDGASFWSRSRSPFASVPVVVGAGDQTAGGAEHPPWQRSARAVGLPAERFQSHSLRIGGASALYQATGEVEVVKRTGRWTSGAVHRYLHDGGDVIKGLAEHMASVEQYVHYT